VAQQAARSGATAVRPGRTGPARPRQDLGAQEPVRLAREALATVRAARHRHKAPLEPEAAPGPMVRAPGTAAQVPVVLPVHTAAQVPVVLPVHTAAQVPVVLAVHTAAQVPVVVVVVVHTGARAPAVPAPDFAAQAPGLASKGVLAPIEVPAQLQIVHLLTESRELSGLPPSEAVAAIRRVEAGIGQALAGTGQPSPGATGQLRAPKPKTGPSPTLGPYRAR
jgi:hypothetical protein